MVRANAWEVRVPGVSQTPIDNLSLPVSREQQNRRSALNSFRRRLDDLEEQYTFLRDMRVGSENEEVDRKRKLSSLKKAAVQAIADLQDSEDKTGLSGYEGMQMELEQLAGKMEEMLTNKQEIK